MHTTFGQRLKRFSDAIDIVEDGTFKKIISLVEEYLEGVLNIQIVRTMAENRHDDGSVYLVKHQLDMVDSFESIKLSDAVDPSEGQMPFAYKIKKPLWIVNQINGGCLDDDNAGYIDLWSGVTDIPKYHANAAESIKTSIIIPIKNGENRVFGVVNFETSDYIEITEIAKQELELLAQTISTLYQLKRTRTVQSRSTSVVIKDLANSLKDGGFPKLTKPKVFVASAKKGDDEVVDVILETLKQYSDKIDIEYWQHMYENGSIYQQLIDAISSCQYGICYLSERDESNSDFQYRDNTNVVFEAGMFHGRKHNSSQSPCGWLPVREENSPPTPFDLLTERTVVIRRNEQHELLVDDLRTSLDLHICKLIGEDK